MTASLVEPFPLIEISGSPYERGHQHGVAAAPRVRRSVEHYEAQLAASGCGLERLADLVREFLPRIEAFDPAYIEEMRGIADAAGVSFEQVVLINARTELLQVARRLPKGATQGKTDGCTGVIVSPSRSRDGRVLHAQNWDWKAECVETTIVLRIRRDDGPDILTMTEAGGLARAGLNAAGLGVTANYLESDRDFAQIGVPLAFVRRKLLESQHMATAINVLSTTPRSVSNNVMLSFRGGLALDFECAPDEIFALQPERGLLVHANHWTSQAALAKLRDTGARHSPDSFYRDVRVRELLEQKTGKLGFDDLREALFDELGHPWSVCRPVRNSALLGNLSATVAMVLLDTEAGFMEVAPMPAVNRVFTRYSFAAEAQRAVA